MPFPSRPFPIPCFSQIPRAADRSDRRPEVAVAQTDAQAAIHAPPPPPEETPVILLIFFYFWRFFSGKRGPSSLGGAADEEASSASSSRATSPRASRRLRNPRQDDVASSLPVSVYDCCSDGADGKAADCAVCIVEFRDGDLARLLPSCGHRFHATCVDAWLQHHATCPLCRGNVVAPIPADGGDPKNESKADDGNGAECPV